MDYESERSRQLGCWDGVTALTGTLDAWTSTDSTPAFEIDDGFCEFLVSAGFGDSFPEQEAAFWRKTLKENYRGDDGRKRARMATINLRDRDGLHGRLVDVRCPVLWLHVSRCRGRHIISSARYRQIANDGLHRGLPTRCIRWPMRGTRSSCSPMRNRPKSRSSRAAHIS